MDSEQDSSAEALTDLMESDSASIGDRLRAAREAKGLDLSHIAAETRIPLRHLESIETGNFAALPSRTYAIGFARTYARAVGMDETATANAVREELADGHAQRSAMAGGMEPGDPAKLPSAGLAWAGGLAALIFAVGAVFFYNTYFGAGADPASLIAEADTQDAVPDSAGQPGAQAAGAAQAPAPTGGKVVFTALEDGVWARFYEDGGERLFEAQMSSGDTFEVPAGAADPRINTGRPDALSITVGGQPVPKLSDEAITLGDTPVSAAALLARAETQAETGTANN